MAAHARARRRGPRGPPLCRTSSRRASAAVVSTALLRARRVRARVAGGWSPVHSPTAVGAYCDWYYGGQVGDPPPMDALGPERSWWTACVPEGAFSLPASPTWHAPADGADALESAAARGEENLGLTRSFSF